MQRGLQRVSPRDALCRLYRWIEHGGRPIDDWARHLDAAAAWIARAQDVGSDDGVAAFYDVQAQRWAASYPETTGYIIPTFYDYAHRTGRQEFFDRATRMAAWETAVQLDSGAVRAGFMDADPVRATVFNTGQVLFGWAAAYRATAQSCFADALRSAADWLVAVQDADGAWRRYGSPFASYGLNTYNCRTALGLLEAADVLGDVRYRDAARANVQWALSQAEDNGWLRNNDLDNNRYPLTHTIGYAHQAILEIGVRLNDPDVIAVARRGLAALRASRQSDGSLPGRLDRHWRPAAPWSCLTGEAQIAYAWLQLASYDNDDRWRAAAVSTMAFVASKQDLQTGDDRIHGAIAGSHPRFGGYMTSRYPNWAAKFFMDALLLLDSPRG